MSGAVVLLAGGAGSRLQAGRPKAFVEVHGRSLLAIAAAAAAASQVADLLLVVAPGGWEEESRRVVGDGGTVRVMAAGRDRADSVRRALEDLADADRVICHDVARPLATPALFRSVAAALAGVEGVVPVVPVTDTVKRVADGMVLETLPRDELAEAQTPQAFVPAALLEAHAAVALAASRPAGNRGAATPAADDASFLQAAGYRVVTVAGEPTNVKVTHPHDLALVEAVLRARDRG